MKETNVQVNVESTNSILFETPESKSRLQDLFCSCFRKRPERPSITSNINMRRLTDLISQNDILVVPNSVMDYYISEEVSEASGRSNPGTVIEKNVPKSEGHNKRNEPIKLVL
ncbi:unnamed protein product [Hymenolepis diminuta]|uniref:Uncharacterized protein n=1 Tax=Hymenolepis diminuta TaxID=6216 RepID=A0A564Y367_HYMDI|nr:unnamed protein product [Hymenolepis diminuta]